MSHFTVLVIGKNWEEQLEPYSEHIEVEPYWANDGTVEKFAEIYGIEPQKLLGDVGGMTEQEALLKAVQAKLDSWSEDGEQYKIEDGTVFRQTTYNPKSKWDWYQMGGRWTGFFKIKTPEPTNDLGFTQNEIENLASLRTKDIVKYNTTIKKYNGISDKVDAYVCKSLGLAYDTSLIKEDENEEIKYKLGELGVFKRQPKKGFADQIQVKDVDFDAMEKEAEEEARKYFKELQNAFGGEIPKLETSWQEILKLEGLTIDQKREKYHSQPSMLKVKEVRAKHPDLFGFFFDLEDFNCTEDEYAARAVGSAYSTFAVVKDGEWFEKGKMGWFGMAHDEKSENQWNEEFRDLLRHLPKDTLLTLVDCHI